MRKYRSFRPYPAHSLGKIPVEIVRRDSWNRIIPDRRLPRLTIPTIPTTPTPPTIFLKPETLPHLDELIKSLGPLEDMPKQRPSTGSPAKCPYLQGYHYETPDFFGERKWVIHSVAHAEEENTSSDESSDDDEIFSDEGEDEMLALWA